MKVYSILVAQIIILKPQLLILLGSILSPTMSIKVLGSIETQCIARQKTQHDFCTCTKLLEWILFIDIMVKWNLNP